MVRRSCTSPGTHGGGNGLATVELRRRGRGRPVVGPDPPPRARRLPAGPADGATRRVRPVQRLRLRDSPGHMPLSADGNVSLAPAAGGPDTPGLIAGVEDGIYILGDKSWSIDMQRYNFQFTGQRFYPSGTASWPAAQGRRLPGEPRRTSGLQWRRSAAANLRPGRRLQLRQGQPGQVARSATAPRQPCSVACACMNVPKKEGLWQQPRQAAGHRRARAGGGQAGRRPSRLATSSPR